MIVLSSPPTGFRGLSRDEQLKSWESFVSTVASSLGSLVDCYQLLNEPNNPVYRIFDADATAEAIRRGAVAVRFRSSASIAVNIAMEIWGWRRYVEELLASTGSVIEILGLDHYPGTWSIGRDDRWKDVLSIARNTLQPGGVWAGRRLAVLETGFSTNTFGRGEGEQQAYFTSLAHLRSALSASRVLVGIYELCDGNTDSFFDPEMHFGIMTTDLVEKTAFRTVRDLIHNL